MTVWCVMATHYVVVDYFSVTAHPEEFYSCDMNLLFEDF